MTKSNWTLAVLATAFPLILASAADARFLQTDPVGYQADPNLYTYVGNNPINKADPRGLYSCGSTLSPDQCGEFQKTQDQAKQQIGGAINSIKTLKTDLASGKLSAQDKAVAAAISKHLGNGAGSDSKVLGSLLGAAGKMLGVLNSDMPAQNGFGSSDYAHADPGQLTLFRSHWASSPTMQIETIAHESSHHGLNTNDIPINVGDRLPFLQPYGHGNINRMADIFQNPDFMMTKADAVTLGLGFERDDNWK